MLDNGTQYCNDGDRTLKLYVNGKRNALYGDYEFNDLDRILISYGSDNETVITAQLAAVTDKVCIQSDKCPERGEPSDTATCTTKDG